MTSAEIIFALLVLVSFAIAAAVFIAITITEFIEMRRARRKHRGN